MGNAAADGGGFHESDDDSHQDDAKQGDVDNSHPEDAHYLPDPNSDEDVADNDAIIYQSQYAMNLYGVTDSGEFVTNAVKRIPAENHVHKIKELFKYKKKLGEGASGKVLLAQQKFGEQKKCALKELHRKQRVNAQLFLREVVILESLQHPNILELFGVYLDRSSYFIATAYYSGGEFFDRIIKIKKFSEKQALKYIKPILGAVQFMHDKAIVHRDLKPSNMVFDRKGKNGQLKIIDFGTSEIVIDDDLYTAERVGTILYAPPEWKRDRIGSHIKKGDLWSLGVIVYVLMVGRLPFGEWKHIEGYKNDLWFPKKLKKKLSYPCIDFILKLLERYPEQRLGAAQALKHAWIAKEDAAHKDVDLGAELKTGLQSVHAESKIAKVIGKVNYGALSINDLDNEQRAIVYENVKNQKDVEKYLAMYNNTNIVNNMSYPVAAPPKQMRYDRYGSKDIMDSIHMFREQDADMLRARQQMNLFNEEMDDDEYELTLKQTMSVMQHKLNEEQKEAELRDMLGNEIYDQIKDEIVCEERQEEMFASGKVPHKNSGNPLNIQCEEDEDFIFDEEIVEQLMQLGLASKNACCRAVLATDSQGVNQAAEWLLNHQNDHGINKKIDVL
eukprot:69186_1